MTQSSSFLTIDGTEWLLKVYPNGCDATVPGKLTLCLEVVNAAEDDFWVRKAELEATVYFVNYLPKSVKREVVFSPQAEEQYVIIELDSSFTHTSQLPDFYKTATVFQINLTLKPVSASEFNTQLQLMSVYYEDGVWEQWRKQELRFQGIQNSGMMCYLISLMQTYFHIPAFRDFVFHMETTDIESVEGPNTLPLALQKLFYNLSGLEPSE